MKIYSNPRLKPISNIIEMFQKACKNSKNKNNVRKLKNTFPKIRYTRSFKTKLKPLKLY